MGKSREATCCFYDANISIMPVGAKKFGTRAEIKNLNSFKALERAIEYEVERQKEILEDGGHVVQETRTWDDAQGMTFSMRSKEEAHDYRYFPEPDRLPSSLMMPGSNGPEKPCQNCRMPGRNG